MVGELVIPPSQVYTSISNVNVNGKIAEADRLASGCYQTPIGEVVVKIKTAYMHQARIPLIYKAMTDRVAPGRFVNVPWRKLIPELGHVYGDYPP